MPLADKLNEITFNEFPNLSPKETNAVNDILKEMSNAVDDTQAGAKSALDNAYKMSTSVGSGTLLVTGLIYVASAAMLLYTAYSLGHTVYNYYHPKYDDIPTAMVDMIETADGDRFIKYDVVFEAEANKKGTYAAADLNAFQAQRWNALYYTKSYEAGNPLLADDFVVNYKNNQAKENYTPVHRFGEGICFNLNKYNFDYNINIYLSVKQSKNQKAAVADVPEVVGSVFGAGFLFLAGGIGLIAGIGGTIATKSMLKKKKADTKE